MPLEPVHMSGDPARLAQVVGNLLNNACKFTDPGGHVSLTVAKEGAQAVIRVRDDGIGIAADQMPRLFEMFTQADTSRERSRDGLGIGLTLVKTLVEMHGGTITARSDGPGRGSEFEVRLPALAEAPRAAAPAAEAPAPSPPRRVLIVDDNVDGADSLAMLLQHGGHETHLAHDGLQAIEAAERLRPDAVLLDIGLPRLNGYDVCQHIRGQPWGRGLTLIALTGWGQDEDRSRSKQAGFDAHLVKPVDYDVLAQVLAAVPAANDAP
jgi:CheY-like chemotaxis protein